MPKRDIIERTARLRGYLFICNLTNKEAAKLANTSMKTVAETIEKEGWQDELTSRREKIKNNPLTFQPGVHEFVSWVSAQHPDKLKELEKLVELFKVYLKPHSATIK